MTAKPDSNPGPDLLTNHSRSFFVKSCAGSGKSTLLTKKFVKLILEGNATIEQVVAITFTEAAASEMKLRIYNELLKVSQDEDEVKRQRAQEALNGFWNSWISTIHSFALKLISEDPFALNLPLTISVLTGIDQQLHINSDLDYIFKQLNQDSHSYDILTCLKLLNITTTQLTDLILNLAKDSCLTKQVKSLDFKTYYEKADQNVKKLKSIISVDLNMILQSVDFTQCTDQDDLLLSHLTKLQILISLFNTLNCKNDSSNYNLCDAVESLLPIINFNFKTTKGNQKNWMQPDMVKAIKERLKKLDDDFSDHRKQLKTNLIAALIIQAAQHLDARVTERRQSGILTFDELIDLAIQLVENPNRKIKRFKHILIDEFQDTDPKQVRLIKALKAAHSEEICFTLVGDHNQSIYSFRGADLKIYQEIERTFDNPIISNNNYRSHPRIVDFVNNCYPDLYKYFFSKGDDEFNYHEMISQRRSEPDSHRVFIIKDNTAQDSQSSSQIRLTEAKFVVSAIKSIANNSTGVRYSDIAILLRTRRSLKAIEHELRRKTIPYRLRTADLIYESKTADDILRILAVITNPEDSATLVASLNTTFFNISQSELLEFKEYLKNWGYRNLTSDIQTSEGNLPHALSKLAHLHHNLIFSTPSYAIEQLAKEFNLWEQFRKSDSQVNDLFILEYLISQAREVEKRRTISLTEYVNLINLIKETSSVKENISSEEPASNAVNIFTIHGSKGLEFPLVFLLGFGDRPSSAEIAKIAYQNNDIKLYLNADLNNYSQEDLETIKSEIKDDMQRELLRLFYVGTTRAKDYLFISAFETSSNSSVKYTSDNTNPKDSIASYLTTLNNGLFQEWHDNGNNYVKLVNQTDKSSDLDSNNLYTDRIEIPINSATDNFKIITATELARQIGIQLGKLSTDKLSDQELITNSYSTESSTTQGIIVHKALEILISTPNFDSQNINFISLTRSIAANYNIFRQSDVEHLAVIIKNTILTVEELLKGFDSTFQVFAEPGLSVALDNLVIRGNLDLLILSKQSNGFTATILDYKTTTHDLSSFTNQSEFYLYELQLMIYKYLVKRSFPQAEVNTFLICSNYRDAKLFQVPTKLEENFDIENNIRQFITAPDKTI